MNEIVRFEDLYPSRISKYYAEVTAVSSKPGLVVPQLILGDLSDFTFTPGNNLLQYRRAETGQEYEGPDVFVRTSFGRREVPTYLLGSHNNACFGWCEGLVECCIERGFIIIHFDQRSHGDYTRMDYTKFDPRNLDQVYDLATTVEPGCFIYPVLETGLACGMVHVCPDMGSESEQTRDVSFRVIKCGYKSVYLLELLHCIRTGKSHHDFGVITSKSLVVDIDIDYFESGSERDAKRGFIRRSISVMRKTMSLAGINTIATSPGFINQRRAIELVTRIMK